MRLSQFVQDTDGILCNSACTIVQQVQYPFYLQSQAVARAFTERERVVVICKALVKPKGLQHGRQLGSKYAEVSVYILTPSNDLGDDNAAPVTTTELRSMMARFVGSGPNASHGQREGDDAIAKRMWIQALAARHDLLEEFLVDASVS